MSTLNGKVALVTGGSRGIGAAIAARLAREGASVSLTFVSSSDKAHAVVGAIEAAGGRATAIKADAADVAQTRAAVEETAARFGRLDILVNNAGVATIGPVETLSIEDFDRIFAVNVRSVFVAAQAAAKHLQDGGRIITIGSVNADRSPFAGLSAYGASKAAVQGMTRGLARDLGPRGITVNVIQPGPVDTDMNPADGPFADMLRASMAIPRYASGDDIATAVAFLASPAAWESPGRASP
jgi:3-oxoacyl-[acyl-carrier protein] reductase